MVGSHLGVPTVFSPSTAVGEVDWGGGGQPYWIFPPLSSRSPGRSTQTLLPLALTSTSHVGGDLQLQDMPVRRLMLLSLSVMTTHINNGGDGRGQIKVFLMRCSSDNLSSTSGTPLLFFYFFSSLSWRLAVLLQKQWGLMQRRDPRDRPGSLSSWGQCWVPGKTRELSWMLIHFGCNVWFFPASPQSAS